MKHSMGGWERGRVAVPSASYNLCLCSKLDTAHQLLDDAVIFKIRDSLSRFLQTCVRGIIWAKQSSGQQASCHSLPTFPWLAHISLTDVAYMSSYVKQ
jgi:hypothetical protein